MLSPSASCQLPRQRLWRFTIVASLICCGCAQQTEKDEARSAHSDDKSRANTSTQPSSDRFFADVTDDSGLVFSYNSGRAGEQYTLLETVGGGVALFDYDADGDLDIFLPGGGRISPSNGEVTGTHCALFRNEGDVRFTNVTAEAGLEVPVDYSHGVTTVDYNCDGWPDLFVTCFGQSRLYRNLGDGTFTDATAEANLDIQGWRTAAAWADVDRDGLVDLFVTGYVDWTPDKNPGWCGDPNTKQRDVCPPNDHEPAGDSLYRNRGDGTFEDITESADLRGDGMGLGVIACDLNSDGWIDFYVANDVTRNFLYLGGPELPLRETAETAGVAYSEFGDPEAGMGVDAGDFDGDELPDLWVTNFEHEDNSLYRNDGNATFTHRTVAAGLKGPWRTSVGFGTGFLDFDSDGWLDLYVANGHVFYHNGRSPYLQRSLLFRNLAGQRFVDASRAGGEFFAAEHSARGAAVGDLDNDGAPDLIVVRQDQPVRLLRNVRPPKRWISLSLRGTRSNADAIGSTLRLPFDGRVLVRRVVSGRGYLSQSDNRIVLPVDSASRSVDVVVEWPGGVRESFTDLLPLQTNVLVEGRGLNPDE